MYIVREGTAQETTVTLGHQNGRDAEVLSGLDAGATVVMHPADTLTNGVKVTVTQPAANDAAAQAPSQN